MGDSRADRARSRHPQTIIDALWSRQMPASLEADHKVLYDLCTELHRERRVSAATHERAIASLGEQGTMDAMASAVTTRSWRWC
jgi:hypothetical protein